MISRQHIEIASKFYEAQKSMKFLHGDNYQAKVDETKSVIERFQTAMKCGVLDATKACIEKIVERYPHNNGLMVAMLLATAVEMMEGAPNMSVERDRATPCFFCGGKVFSGTCQSCGTCMYPSPGRSL